jgi:5-methylcytosine-specific restriction endonuclease McrA
VFRKTRRKLNATGKYPCEICQECNFLVQHHIQGRDIKNANKHSNLANICSNCHLKVHKAEIVIEKRVMTTSGEVLMWHKVNESSVTGEDAIPYTF